MIFRSLKKINMIKITVLNNVTSDQINLIEFFIHSFINNSINAIYTNE